jgi:tellurite resistance protein
LNQSGRLNRKFFNIAPLQKKAAQVDGTKDSTRERPNTTQGVTMKNLIAGIVLLLACTIANADGLIQNSGMKPPVSDDARPPTLNIISYYY